MLSPSLAFSWLLWRQHGGTFLAILFTLGIAAIAAAVLPTHLSEGFAGGVAGLSLILTLQVPVMCLLFVFTYAAENADLASRESCFPQRLLRLPVPTYSLVLWPMVYGSALAVLLWLANSWLVLGPWMALSNETPPRWWPATLMTAALAWMQAILWLPFGLRWIRAFLLVGLFTGVIPLAVAAGRSDFADAWFAWLFAGLTVVAWGAGYIGIVHARRGDVPNWDSLLAPLRLLAHRPPSLPVPFSAPARAQGWLEWRLTGMSLPFCTFLVLIVALIPLRFGANDVLPIWQTLLTALACPILVGGLMGGWPGHGHAPRPQQSGIMPFLATFPLSEADIVAAILKAAVRSTLAAWVVVVVMIPLALALTGNLGEIRVLWEQVRDEMSGDQMAVGLGVAVLFLLVWTWKRRVDGLFVGLTGRVWITGMLMTAGFSIFGAMWAIAMWWQHPENHADTLAVLPWLLTLIVLCRLTLAVWALRENMRQGLLKARTVWHWLMAWVAVASLLFGLLAWSVPGEWVARYYLAFAVLFAMPMARLSAAPLALAWNRHR